MRFGDTIVHENDDGEDNEGTVEDQEVLENSMNESEPVDYISTFPVKSWKSTKAIINSSMHSTKNLFGVISSAEKSNAALSITIPFGFQMMRSLPHSRATIASVINIPSASTVDTFVSLDSHNIHIWKGANHVKNIPTAALPGRHDAVALRADSAKLGVAGISKWLYVEKYRIYIVTSVQMHIRVRSREKLFPLLHLIICFRFSIRTLESYFP